MATFITAQELSERIKYDARYIRERLVDNVLLEGIHYVRPFGRRKILFVWESIENELLGGSSDQMDGIPLTAGGTCHG